MQTNKLLGESKAVNVGLEWFYESLKAQGVSAVNIEFRPPAGGKKELIDALISLDNEAVENANKEATDRIVSSQPMLVDVMPARKIVPGMDSSEPTIYHAGPPIEYEKMCGPMKGAVLGAAVYEGWAKNLAGAEKLASSGKIKFDPCHHHDAVGPMAGVLSPSMFVFVVKNEKWGNFAYCSLNEGLGKALRFGANGPEIIKRLKWMEKVLGPALQKIVRKIVRKNRQGISIKRITAQALTMGDECHNRNVAATGLFLKEIISPLVESGLPQKTVKDVANFISGNPHFFLNLSMAACKASCDPALGIKGSTIIAVISRNGVEIGMKVAGLPNLWFTAPAGMPKGLYFPGFTEDDANPDIGDSTISETAGIGAFAMAAAPAIVKFVGGKAQDSIDWTRKMYDICFAKHRDYLIPAFDFAGTPVGIDVRRVVETGITPFINTGIAHKNPGIGQVGAGILLSPMEPFEQALLSFTSVSLRGAKP
ncbi:MAG: DUF1116 domain-containing protein [Elusimicrobiota bacterium]